MTAHTRRHTPDGHSYECLQVRADRVARDWINGNHKDAINGIVKARSRIAVAAIMGLVIHRIDLDDHDRLAIINHVILRLP